MDSFPDLDSLGDDELKELLAGLVAEEREIATEQQSSASSYRRRILHGKSDVIRAELARRRRRWEDGAGP